MKLKYDIKEYVGKRFNNLTVLSRSYNNLNGESFFNCLCDCGKEKRVQANRIRNGKTKSCGCKHIRNGNFKHGLYRSTENIIWMGIKGRCYTPTSTSYKNYGARGIKMCDRWKNSFENFLADMGKRPSKKHSIERINNNGNYEPSNCKWATNLEQSKNKRTTKKIAFNGEVYCMIEWAEKLNISYQTLQHRFMNGWNIEEALTTPLIEANSHRNHKKK